MCSLGTGRQVSNVNQVELRASSKEMGTKEENDPFLWMKKSSKTEHSDAQHFLNFIWSSWVPMRNKVQ